MSARPDFERSIVQSTGKWPTLRADDERPPVDIIEVEYAERVGADVFAAGIKYDIGAGNEIPERVPHRAAESRARLGAGRVRCDGNERDASEGTPCPGARWDRDGHRAGLGSRSGHRQDTRRSSRPDRPRLTQALNDGLVVMHPFIVGELACVSRARDIQRRFVDPRRSRADRRKLSTNTCQGDAGFSTRDRLGRRAPR